MPLPLLAQQNNAAAIFFISQSWRCPSGCLGRRYCRCAESAERCRRPSGESQSYHTVII